MTPEEHRKARAAHENALCRSIWLKMARDASLDAGYAVRAWEKAALWRVIGLAIGSLCVTLMAFDYPGLP